MFVTLYWVVSLLGMVDMDTVDVGDLTADVSSDVGGDVTDLSATGLFTGLLLKLGLYGVPLVVILTLVSLIGWVLSYLYTSFLHQYLSSGIFYYIFGTGALLFVLVVSMWLTGLIISPIRKNISQIPKRNAASNIGKIAVVRTLSVTSTHGEAALSDGGAGLILKVRLPELIGHSASSESPDSNDSLASNHSLTPIETQTNNSTPNHSVSQRPLSQGDKVVLLEYDSDKNVYYVAPVDDA